MEQNNTHHLENQKSTNLFDRKGEDYARVFYHITPISNVHFIKNYGLLPNFGCRARDAKESTASVWLLTDLDALEDCLLNWADNFSEEDDLAIIRAELPEDFPLIEQPLMPCEKVSRQTVPAEYLSFFSEEGDPLVPVGRLDFLHWDRNGHGKVGESIEYYTEKAIVAAVKEELDSGVPLEIVLYRDKQGNTISRNFLLDLDCLPKGLREEDLPVE